MGKRDIIVHTHIFKNAGSSFDSSLGENFAEDFVDHRDDADIVKGKQDYLEKYLNEHTSVKAFSSHSIHFKPQNTESLTLHNVYMLRHPIERIKSVFSFEKKQEPITTKGAKKAKELSFEEYISWYMQADSPATIRETQTIFLSGDGPAPSQIENKHTLALQTLSNEPNLIGVVDRYDESMVVFEEKLKPFFSTIDLSYIRRNVTDTDLKSSAESKAEKLLSQLSVKTRESVIEHNQYDLELYKKANTILDIEKSKIPNFENKLQQFTDRCLVRQLTSLFNKKRYEDVVLTASNRIDEKTKNPHIYLNTIEAFMMQKEYGMALKVCEKFIEVLPMNSWGYFKQIEILILNENPEKAQKMFTTFCVKFPEKSDMREKLKSVVK